MTGYTPNYDLPYPEDETLISESAPIVQELAEKIDAQMFALFDGNPITPSGDQVHNRDRTPPGVLVEKITTSMLWTKPDWLVSGHVVVISGGGNGQPERTNLYAWPIGGTSGPPQATYGYADYTHAAGRGGCGGTCRVYRVDGFPRTSEVIIGGPAGTSSFQGLSARSWSHGTGQMHPANGFADLYDPGMWWPGYPLSLGGNYVQGYQASDGRWGVESAGGWGVIIAGEAYAGGGGHFGANGRDGGGWSAGWSSPGRVSTPGEDGRGGGGGGSNLSQSLGNSGPSNGGSGVVLVFSDQTPPTRDYRAPNPIAPTSVAALDGGVMVGSYAVNPAAPTVRDLATVPYPTEPVPTGETYDDGTPVLAWPEPGWHYNDGEWSPPND